VFVSASLSVSIYLFIILFRAIFVLSLLKIVQIDHKTMKKKLDLCLVLAESLALVLKYKR